MTSGRHSGAVCLAGLVLIREELRGGEGARLSECAPEAVRWRRWRRRHVRSWHARAPSALAESSVRRRRCGVPLPRVCAGFLRVAPPGPNGGAAVPRRWRRKKNKSPRRRNTSRRRRRQQRGAGRPCDGRAALLSRCSHRVVVDEILFARVVATLWITLRDRARGRRVPFLRAVPCASVVAVVT